MTRIFIFLGQRAIREHSESTQNIKIRVIQSEPLNILTASCSNLTLIRLFDIFQALGFGQTRGRLYIKHPELFKYSGDQTDKEWLAKANLMATTGGKVG